VCSTRCVVLTRPRVGDVDYRGTDVLRGDHPFRQVREEGQVLSIRWFLHLFHSSGSLIVVVVVVECRPSWTSCSPTPRPDRSTDRWKDSVTMVATPRRRHRHHTHREATHRPRHTLRRPRRRMDQAILHRRRTRAVVAIVEWREWATSPSRHTKSNRVRLSRSNQRESNHIDDRRFGSRNLGILWQGQAEAIQAGGDRARLVGSFARAVGLLH